MSSMCLVVIDGKLTQKFTNKGLRTVAVCLRWQMAEIDREVLWNDLPVNLDPLIVYSHHHLLFFLPHMMAIQLELKG